MHIQDLREDDIVSEKVAQEFLSQGRKKEITSAIESIISDEFYNLEEYASSHISDVAKTRAEAFLKRVLQGDKDAAAALFGAGDEHRYRQLGYDKGKPWANLIHGSLFETEQMKLRRDLVEAHVDLLRDERIRDLESTVEGLTQQIRSLEKQLYER
jgi:hypothetical protein